MNTQLKEEIIAASLFVAFLIWAMYHFFSSSNQNIAVDIQGVGQGFDPNLTETKYIPVYGVGNVPLAHEILVDVTPLLNTPQTSLLSPVGNLPSLPSTPDQPCTTCPASPYLISSLASMAANTETFGNAIIAAGNSTLEALAQIGEQENPLLQVTVG